MQNMKSFCAWQLCFLLDKSYREGEEEKNPNNFKEVSALSHENLKREMVHKVMFFCSVGGGGGGGYFPKKINIIPPTFRHRFTPLVLSALVKNTCSKR